MSVSLSYRTSSLIGAASKAAILEDARRVNVEREWWCEGINFFDNPEFKGCLNGDTKLFLIGYSTDNGGFVEVDPNEDCFMVARDVAILAKCLVEWSKKYGVDWILEIGGANVGEIRDGLPTAGVQKYVEGVAFGGKPISSPDETEERAREISRKYASRWG